MYHRVHADVATLLPLEWQCCVSTLHHPSKGAHAHTPPLCPAVPWIEDGWVTVITGKGQGRNHISCQSRLDILKQLDIVQDYTSSFDNGAIFVRLRKQ